MSKQEKLAAARKKLKEFQGKNKNFGESSSIKKLQNWESSKDSSLSCTPVFDEKRSADFGNGLSNLPNYQEETLLYDQKRDTLAEIEHFCNISTQSPNLSQLNEEELTKKGSHPQTDNNVSPDQYNTQLNSICDTIYSTRISQQSYDDIETINGCHTNHGKTENDFLPHYHNSHVNSWGNETQDNMRSSSSDQKQSVEALTVLNEALKPLQQQLENHVQTIAILVGEKNELQITLGQKQTILNEKLDEIEELKMRLTSSNSITKNLEVKSNEMENLIRNLETENRKLIKCTENFKSELEQFQVSFESKEEEESEMKQKLQAKKIECKNLKEMLHDIQAQLSMCQIRVQQLTSSDPSSVSIQVCDLQHENAFLKQELHELKKVLEISNAEKEQSSQNFHVYAQQCNSQLETLNTQVNGLMSENHALKQENEILKNKTNVEIQLNRHEIPLENHKSELADLQSQVNFLAEANTQFELNLSSKNQVIDGQKRQLDEREEQLRELESMLKKIRADNARLQTEMESSSCNEKLLAAMESDKIAAARAVSQNQKLKEQLFELEQGFVKLSHEKLELTDKLAHEKFLYKELLERSRASENNSNCCSEHELADSSVNDGQEVEQLTTIIRQLQDDKAELLSRLNLVNCASHSFHDNEVSVRSQEDEPYLISIEAGTSETSNALLQQMEEKVKRTMNEIAILDEEKQKLEHLVLQLQGETETIGEYISLYQKQRMLLRQRNKEKDDQLIQLSRDKEELRSKLSSLDELVAHLLAEKQSENLCEQTSVYPCSASTTASDKPEITAGKIRALITEIGSTSLVNNHSVAFEHCPCCSGRLINI